nr:hypothetical protein [Escherichia coli]
MMQLFPQKFTENHLNISSLEVSFDGFICLEMMIIFPVLQCKFQQEGDAYYYLFLYRFIMQSVMVSAAKFINTFS